MPTDQELPLHADSYKEFLSARLLDWWPKDGADPKSPAVLDDATFEAFGKRVAAITPKLTRWFGLATWFSQQVNAWESWDAAPPAKGNPNVRQIGDDAQAAIQKQIADTKKQASPSPADLAALEYELARLNEIIAVP